MVMYKLGNIEAQLAALNSKLDKKEGEQDAAISRMQDRISTLEGWRAKILGGSVALGSLGGFVVNLILKVI